MVLFGLNTAPQVFTRLGHTVTGYLHRQGISVIPYLDDWLINSVIPYLDDWLINSPPRPPSSTPILSSAHKYAGPSRLYPKQKVIRAGPDPGSPVSRNPFTSGLRGSVPSRVQSLGDSYSRTPSILPPSTDLFSSVPAYGITQLGFRFILLGRLYLRPLQRHFHSLGLTDRFTPPRRSDPLILANLLRHWQNLCFLTSGMPIRMFQADFTIFRDASMQGWGAHMGDSRATRL